ncbi:MAG: class I SAM-dependent methyltransferase [Gallionella sp.]
MHFGRLMIRVLAKFEREFLGIDFQGGLSAESLGLDPKLSVACMPSGGKYLRSILQDLSINSSDSILDIGCGKGNAMRGMYNFPFLRIDGIELSEKIAKLARHNFQRLRVLRTSIFNISATDFDGYSNYNIFYLYNPFTSLIMGKVMENINQSNVSDRELLIIYNNPVCHAQIEMAGFTKILQYPDEWGNGIYVYTNKPASSRLKKLGV